MNILYTINIINFILLQGPTLPGDGNGNTDIDDLPIDDYLSTGVIIAIIIGFLAIFKMRKIHWKA